MIIFHNLPYDPLPRIWGSRPPRFDAYGEDNYRYHDAPVNPTSLMPSWWRHFKAAKCNAIFTHFWETGLVSLICFAFSGPILRNVNRWNRSTVRIDFMAMEQFYFSKLLRPKLLTIIFRRKSVQPPLLRLQITVGLSTASGCQAAMVLS